MQCVQRGGLVGCAALRAPPGGRGGRLRCCLCIARAALGAHRVAGSMQAQENAHHAQAQVSQCTGTYVHTATSTAGRDACRGCARRRQRRMHAWACVAVAVRGRVGRWLRPGTEEACSPYACSTYAGVSGGWMDGWMRTWPVHPRRPLRSATLGCAGLRPHRASGSVHACGKRWRRGLKH